MTFLKKFSVGLVLTLALFWAGCNATLDPTGVYGQLGTAGQWIYTSDVVVDQSYNLVDAGVQWELQNYTFLKTNSPNVVAFFETIKTNAPKYFGDYSLASAAFRSSIGTIQEVGASNTVVAASIVISNITTTVTEILTNTPGTVALSKTNNPSLLKYKKGLK